MPNKNIFCNAPWYELHIYWDGSLGICCKEDHKLYIDNSYNIATMSIADWFNSEPARQLRTSMFDDKQKSVCRGCYIEENFGNDSKRIRGNQKSVIFTRQAFQESYLQSPHYKHFSYSQANRGITDTLPVDLHIDLGNYCNLACKMCNAKASSTIAVQEISWGIESSRQYIGTDWTRNESVWNKFLDDVVAIPNLKNIHFMGGETLLTDRVEQLVDHFINLKKFDVCFSFVTNGTVYNSSLVNKFKLFERAGIEVSIETVDEHNSYQRQGTNTSIVLENIDQYLSACNNSSITVALRPAPSLLTVGYYAGLLRYALDKKLIVRSNLCFDPKFLHPIVLPVAVKKKYLPTYIALLNELADVDIDTDYNASDPNNYRIVIKEQAQIIKNLLESPAPVDAEALLKRMVEHCRQWDRVYGLDARALYPELSSVWDQYGY